MTHTAVKPGYQVTELGVIPEDWEVKQIRDVCKLINGRGFKPYEWKDFGLPIIRIQNLNGSDEFNYFDGAYDKKIEVYSGQLLFAWSGSRGTSFGPHIWDGTLGLLNYHTWKVEVFESAINKNYFLFALKQLTNFIENKAHGASALVHTQKWEMEGFHILLPPLPEQKAIAAALSDVDALITAQEALIAKKRDIKTATMQQLLTGKVRLGAFGQRAGASRGESEDGVPPGYQQTELGVIPADWEIIRLSEISSKVTVGIASAATHAYRQQGIPLIRNQNIKLNKLDDSDILYIDPEYEKKFEGKRLLPNDLLTARTGYPGTTCIVPPKFKNAQSFTTLITRINSSKVEIKYLCFYINSEFGQSFFEINQIGGGQKNVNAATLKSMSIPLPPLPEQKAIAKVLSDMDAEITALEAQCDKTRAIKQGMMQELLTGKTRLL